MTNPAVFIAQFRLWLHRQMVSAPHYSHAEDNLYDSSAPVRVACTCGKVFWEKKV